MAANSDFIDLLCPLLCTGLDFCIEEAKQELHTMRLLNASWL
jgi:hypothetical protein